MPNINTSCYYIYDRTQAPEPKAQATSLLAAVREITKITSGRKDSFFTVFSGNSHQPQGVPSWFGTWQDAVHYVRENQFSLFVEKASEPPPMTPGGLSP